MSAGGKRGFRDRGPRGAGVGVQRGPWGRGCGSAGRPGCGLCGEGQTASQTPPPAPPPAKSALGSGALQSREIL